jgi:hypothetical protein
MRPLCSREKIDAFSPDLQEGFATTCSAAHFTLLPLASDYWAGRGTYFGPAKNQRLPDGSFTPAASNSSSPSPQGRSEGSIIDVAPA